MAGPETQRKVFDLLKAKFVSRGTFSKEELAKAGNWAPKSVGTYISKQFKGLVLPTGNGLFTVGPAFVRYSTWAKFRELVTQVKTISLIDTVTTFSAVIVYDFFMPLTNEDHLRRGLDALFYKDSVRAGLLRLGLEEIKKHIPANEGERDEDYLERVCRWVDDRFSGYSILHVSGRFKVPPLRTMADALALQQSGERYLIDETTAVARFIFRCGAGVQGKTPLSEKGATPWDSPGADKASIDEAQRVRWFFWGLFVDSIVQVVDGQDEIWMVESGMQSRLHVFSRERKDE